MSTTLEYIDQQDVLAAAYVKYGKGLTIRAFFKTSDHALSEDLVQDTFMKTWSFLVKGGKVEIMKAFLYHVLNHLIVDQYRKHKTTSLDSLLESGYEPSAGDQSAKLFDILDGKSLLLLIKDLPKMYAEVMRLRYMQNLSLEEISLVTGRSRNTIAVQLHRGLAKLRLLYELA